MCQILFIMVPIIIFLILVIKYIAWNYANVKAFEQWKEIIPLLSDEELIAEMEDTISEREFISNEEFFDRMRELQKEFEVRAMSEKFEELNNFNRFVH